jgi:O-acetyl-ADP-ribose deacetylase (regulator of RNase III)
MKIRIIRGDITKIKADAIVNAANSGMLGGGGVDGAIRRAAGPGLQEECIRLRKETIPNGLETGKATITKAYNLPAKIVIHTVGPRYYSGDINLLNKCYTNCLKLAEENNCESIAFPTISTGDYGCPIEKSAEILSEVLENFKSDIIKEIILVLFDEEDFNVYKNVLENGMKTDLNEIMID